MDPRISREPPVNPNLPAFTTANLETPRAKWTKSYESNRTAGDCRSESQLPLNSQESYKKNLENNGNKIAALVHVQRDPRLAPGSSQIKVAHKPEENARGVKRDRSEMGGIDETGNNCGVEREERTKRQRGECFRCGGRNHIVLVCTSTERDAYKNANLEKCGACNGRGHSPDNCPTIVNANPCYNCRQQGHFARDCPYNGNNQYHTKPKPLIYEYNNNNTMPLNQTIVSQLRQYGYSDPAQLYAALNVSNLSTGNVPVGPYPPCSRVSEREVLSMRKRRRSLDERLPAKACRRRSQRLL